MDLENTKDTILLINFLNQINKTSLAIYTGRKAIYKNIYIAISFCNINNIKF